VRRADNGQPIANATIGLTSDHLDVSGLYGEVRSDPSGHYEFSGIRPGSEYHVHASKTGYLYQTYDEGAPAPQQAITVPLDGQVNNIDFRLVRAGVITGTVLNDDNDPIEGIDIQAVRLRFEPGLGATPHIDIVKTARTDDIGDYRLAGLQAGLYYVRIAPPKQRKITGLPDYPPLFYPRATSSGDAQGIQIDPGAQVQDINLHLPLLPTFTIHVTVSDTGPISATTYSVGTVEDTGPNFSSTRKGYRSYDLPGFVPGDYMLVAEAKNDTNGRRSYKDVRVIDGNLDVAIGMDDVGEVRGQMQMDDRSFWSAKFFQIDLWLDSSIRFFQFGEPDSLGRFDIKGLAEGSYTFQAGLIQADPGGAMYLSKVTCDGQDYTSRPFPVAAKEIGECTLTMGRSTGMAEGTVVAKDAQGWTVVFLPVDRQARSDRTLVATTDASGKFSLAVPPGDYYAFALLPSDNRMCNDLNFLERNSGLAKRVSIPSGYKATLMLEPLLLPN
jgi:hypothetical protein